MTGQSINMTHTIDKPTAGPFATRTERVVERDFETE